MSSNAQQSSSMERITRLEIADVRFPTSLELHGSDAMNPDPDYSAAYVSIHTSAGAVGYGLTFTIGRGNEVMCAAISALESLVVGMAVSEMQQDHGLLSHRLLDDSQLRWLGPEKGIIHMAIGAVVNAAWDLLARKAEMPMWQYVSSLTPAQLVECIDFRYIDDALTPAEALEIFERGQVGKEERIAILAADGYPAYTTTPGWLGYSDDLLTRLCHEAVEEGFSQIKLKVGAELQDDKHRLRIARQAVGPDIEIAIDANQRWGVDEAIRWTNELQEFDIAWVEEPTSPDDVVGHAAIAKGVSPIPVATGEHCQNRVMFKQFLQLDGLQVLQIDAARVAGANENIAILAMAAKFGVRVCAHAGGVGLCEVVRHLSFFDYAVVSTSLVGRMLEWVDHLHEHFTVPASIVDGNYAAPTKPGFSAEMFSDSIREYTFRAVPPEDQQ